MEINDPMPSECLLSAKVEWLPGFNFRWLGTQINSFKDESEANQIALYFDGQFSLEGLDLPKKL